MQDISCDELKERLDKGEEIKIVDVREEFEYEDFNIGALLIPLAEIPKRVDELKPYKDIELVVHCRSGGRSGAAKEMLTSIFGFTKVRNLVGGMLEWQEKFGS